MSLVGYFNYFVKCVIRKLVNFIFNKKNFFKFCCILFLILVITKLFLQTPISYGATTLIGDTTYYDGYLANIEIYEGLQNDLINRLEKNKNSVLYNEIMNLLNSSSYYTIMFYGTGLTSSNINSFPVDKTFLNIAFLDRSRVDRTVTNVNWNNNGSVTASVLTSQIDVVGFRFGNDSLARNNWGAGTFFTFPSYMVDYKSDSLISYLLSYFDTSSDDLQDVIQESTNTIVESNQQTQNTIKEQTNTIKEQTEFLTSNTISDDSFVLPKDNTNDNTGVDDDINFIFDDIMSAFTDTSSNNSITLTFPFVNQTFDISYVSVYNGVFEKNNSMAYLKRIIQLGYWYIVAVFVIKDISNKVNKVKTGDIDKIQTGNIKEDLL